MDLPDVRVRHVRDMVEDIAKRKKLESEKVRCREKYVIYNTAILSFLILIQTILNILQGSGAVSGEHRIRIIAISSTIIGVIMACIGKHVLDTKRQLVKCIEQLQQMERAEDSFMLELGITLEDGKLTNEEHQRLISMMNDFRKTLDIGSLKKIHPYYNVTRKNGTGDILTTSSGVLHGTPDQHEDRSEEHPRQDGEETLVA